MNSTYPYNSSSYAVQATIQQSVTSSFMAMLGVVKMQGQSVHSVRAVDLASYCNVDAIAMDGAYIAAGKGLDGNAISISAKLFSVVRNQNTSLNHPGLLTWRGNLFFLGKPSTATNSSNYKTNGVLNSTITLPSGNYSQILVLATTGYGPYSNAQFKVAYTDGSTVTTTRAMSDWVVPQSYAGETEIIEMPYRIRGGTDNGGGISTGGVSSSTGTKNVTYIYGYSINVDNTRTLKSLTPPQSCCLVAGMTTRPVILAVDVVP